MVTLSVLLFVVFIVTGVVSAQKKNSVNVNSKATTVASIPTTSNTTASLPPTVANTDTPIAITTNTSGFKDGTFSATSSYATPENTENIAVTVVLKDGVIIDSAAVPSARSRESRDYAYQFVENYKLLVIGKKLTSVKLSRVSGSSLTSHGFDEALRQIENQAKV